jgi:hypothetical protein
MVKGQKEEELAAKRRKKRKRKKAQERSRGGRVLNRRAHAAPLASSSFFRFLRLFAADS